MGLRGRGGSDSTGMYYSATPIVRYAAWVAAWVVRLSEPDVGGLGALVALDRDEGNLAALHQKFDPFAEAGFGHEVLRAVRSNNEAKFLFRAPELDRAGQPRRHVLRADVDPAVDQVEDGVHRQVSRRARPRGRAVEDHGRRIARLIVPHPRLLLLEHTSQPGQINLSVNPGQDGHVPVIPDGKHDGDVRHQAAFPHLVRHFGVIRPNDNADPAFAELERLVDRLFDLTNLCAVVLHRTENLLPPPPDGDDFLFGLAAEIEV